MRWTLSRSSVVIWFMVMGQTVICFEHLEALVTSVPRCSPPQNPLSARSIQYMQTEVPFPSLITWNCYKLRLTLWYMQFLAQFLKYIYLLLEQTNMDTFHVLIMAEILILKSLGVKFVTRLQGEDSRDSWAEINEIYTDKAPQRCCPGQGETDECRGRWMADIASGKARRQKQGESCLFNCPRGACTHFFS